MTDRLTAILDYSISALQAGVPLDEILSEVPEYAADLRPLLMAAQVLADPQPNLLPAETKATLRAEYLKQAADLPEIQPWPFTQKFRAVLQVIKKRTTPAAILSDAVTIVLTALFTLLILTTVLYFTAQSALPGDFLYGVKRSAETVQLSLTLRETDRDRLTSEFNRRRLSEIEQLIEQNRAAVIEFRGVVQTISDNLWIVENHTVFLPNDITIPDVVNEGDVVNVVGLLRTNNVLVADTIMLVENPSN
jgi:hypothetical protein